MAALKKENIDLRDREKAATDMADRMVRKNQEANQLAKRYKNQLNMVYFVRNRTWIHGIRVGI
jgi:hypothetical protein